MEFKVGDRVVGTGTQSEVDFTGQTGTIKHIGDNIAVEWDRQIWDISDKKNEGHDCDGNCRKAYGWFIGYTTNPVIKLIATEPEASKFKVGDRVKCIKKRNPVSEGDTGTILDISKLDFSVNWDKHNRVFHDCNGKCKDGHGYYMKADELELLNANSFVAGTDPASGSFSVIGGSISNIDYGSFSTIGVRASNIDKWASIHGNANDHQNHFISSSSIFDKYLSKPSYQNPCAEIDLPGPSTINNYRHDLPNYVGKSQQANSIHHTQQLDEFLLLNI